MTNCAMVSEEITNIKFYRPTFLSKWHVFVTVSCYQRRQRKCAGYMYRADCAGTKECGNLRAGITSTNLHIVVEYTMYHITKMPVLLFINIVFDVV